MKTRISGIASTVAPWLIIGGLLYSGFFVKPKPAGKTIAPPPIEKRDNFFGVVAPVPNVVWAVGSYGKIVRSDDFGKSWVVQESPVKVHLQGIAAWDATRAVAVGNKGVVLTTSNGGKTWSRVEAPLSDVANKFLRVRALEDGSGWIVGEMGAVLYSRDYGSTWNRAIEEEDVAWNDIHFVGEKGWIVGEFGRIMMSNDNGKNWINVDSPVQTSLTSVHFKDQFQGVAVGLEGNVLYTSDGGKNWSVATKATNEHLFSVIYDGSSWIAVGDKGVLVTNDSISSKWKSFKSANTNMAWYTEILNSGTRYYLSGESLDIYENGKLTSIEKKSR